MIFEWDKNKDIQNQEKHGVSFDEAKRVFLDGKRIIITDTKHSTKNEERYFCFGKVDGYILTVRFTYRNNIIRIFGAGYWREGVKRYEKEHKI